MTVKSQPTPEQVARFAALFAGLASGYGTYELSAQRVDERGKVVGRAQTHRGPVMEELHARHLRGECGLGIVPVNEAGQVSFAALDIDDYAGLVLEALARRLAAFALPVVVARSKSGGAHILTFLREAAPASEVRAVLHALAHKLGYVGCEIFPKQIAPTTEGLGSWLNLPYYGGDATTRYALNDSGHALGLDGFLLYVEQRRVTLDELRAKVEALPEPEPEPEAKAGAPSNAEREADDGQPWYSGERNTRLFKKLCALREQGLGDQELEAAAERLNVERCQPPLDPREVAQTLRSVQRYAPGPNRERGLLAYPYTDAGNAERLASRYGAALMFVPSRGWLAWDGARWALDETRAATRAAIETMRALRREAAAEPDPERARRGFKFALACENAARVRALLKLAEAQERLVVRAEELDQDPYAFNCRNGVLDLRTGMLRPHAREERLTKLAPVDFDPKARAPHWERFLRRVLPDPEQRAFAQRVAGLSLIGELVEQICVFVYGDGANGKTTFLNALHHVFGDYAQGLDFATLLVSKHERVRNDLAALHGVRLAIAAEIEEGRQLSEVTLKEVTGGGRIRARFLYREEFEFVPVFTLWASVNHLPQVRGTDEAIWRRMLVLPFTEFIGEGERDPALPRKLAAEASGVLSWAVEGLADYRAQGLAPPDSVRAASKRYRESQDQLARFLSEECIVHPNAHVTARELQACYSQWCRERGETPFDARALAHRLRQRGARDVRARARQFPGVSKDARVWRGVGLAAAGEAVRAVL